MGLCVAAVGCSYMVEAEAVRWWVCTMVEAEAVCARLCALCGVCTMVEPQHKRKQTAICSLFPVGRSRSPKICRL